MNFLEVGKREIAMSTKVIELVGEKRSGSRIGMRDLNPVVGQGWGLGGVRIMRRYIRIGLG